MGKAIQDLRKEHEAILHVFDIMDKMLTTNTINEIIKLQYYSELVYFLRIFADKCHHGKEENYLFLELVKLGISNVDELIGALVEEHVQGRNFLALMNQFVESKDIVQFNRYTVKYRDLMKEHIEKENTGLFNMADKLLDNEKQNEIYDNFERHEESVIGHGVHEELHSMIHRWAEDLEVK